MTTVPNKAASKARGASASIPAGAKAPQDHQPAKEDVTGPQDVLITYPAGDDAHEYVIAGAAMDDAELLEYFTDENFVGALRILLGAKGWADYKANARNAEGRVTATGAAEFLNHVLQEVKRGNS